jgi:hypothetical protein
MATGIQLPSAMRPRRLAGVYQLPAPSSAYRTEQDRIAILHLVSLAADGHTRCSVLVNPDTVWRIVGRLALENLSCCYCSQINIQNIDYWRKMVITISNDGQRILKTNYWDTEHAAAGFFYLSWNAGAGRLLIPDSQKSVISEFKKTVYVIVSRGKLNGRDALELLFEDHSDEPYCIHIVSEQCDRLIPDHEQGGGFVIAVWTQSGLKCRYPGKYRVVDSLPCLDEWSEH